MYMNWKKGGENNLLVCSITSEHIKRKRLQWWFECKIIFTFGGLVPVVRNIKPFGSFVRNLKDIKLCLPVVSHGGRIWKWVENCIYTLLNGED